MQDKSTEIFKNAPIPKAVLANVIPSVISMLMVLAYNLADTFFIGQTKNPLMVAAVSIATPAFLLFMAIGMLFGVGGTSLISRSLGEGNPEKAKHVSAFCFWTGTGIGVLGMIAMWCFLTPICLIVGASQDTMEYTKQYISIVALGVPFLIVSNSFSNIIRAEGKANQAMIGMIVGNLTNIVLDPIMILGFGWGIRGAAIATVVGNMCGAGYYIFHLISKRSSLSIRLKDYMVGNKIAQGVLLIGIPASLNSILMSTSNIMINRSMTAHGDMAVAGLGVAMKVNLIVVMLLIGIGVGIQPLLGYCYGARNKKRFIGVIKFSLVLVIGLGVTMTVICYTFAGDLVRAFLDNQDAFGYSLEFVRLLMLSGPILGVLFVFMNTLQAMGAAFPSLILSVSRQGLIYLPILKIFETVFDEAKMLVLAQPVTDYIASTLAVILFIIAYKKAFKNID